MVKKCIRLVSLFCVCSGFAIILNAASPHTVYGVLDRYTDNGMAVILLEDRKEEWVVDSEELPESIRDGVWFEIEVDGDDYVITSIDWHRTNAAEKQSNRLMDQLRSK